MLCWPRGTKWIYSNTGPFLKTLFHPARWNICWCIDYSILIIFCAHLKPGSFTKKCWKCKGEISAKIVPFLTLLLADALYLFLVTTMSTAISYMLTCPFFSESISFPFLPVKIGKLSLSFPPYLKWTAILSMSFPFPKFWRKFPKPFQLQNFLGRKNKPCNDKHAELTMLRKGTIIMSIQHDKSDLP